MILRPAFFFTSLILSFIFFSCTIRQQYLSSQFYKQADILLEKNADSSQPDFLFQNNQLQPEGFAAENNLPALFFFADTVKKGNKTNVIKRDTVLQKDNPGQTDTSTTKKQSSLKDTLINKADRDTAKLHPLIIAGTGLFAAGIVAGVLTVTGPMISFVIPLALIVTGIILITIGLKKIKKNPAKYKGDKLALAAYYVLALVAAALIFYPVWLLFNGI